MKHVSPLVTALVVVLGLAGFLVVNSTQAKPAPSAADTSTAAAPTSAAGATSAPAASTTTAATATAATTTAAAGGATRFPAEVVYAGRADGSVLAIAVAVKGTQAAAYLCDGNKVEAWLKGAATGDQVQAAATNGARLTGHLDGGKLAGTVVADGKTYTFRIDVAKPPAGLYRGQSGSIRIGWIVLPDGSQVGIATAGGPSGPAPQLDTTSRTVTVNGEPVVAEPVAGDRVF